MEGFNGETGNRFLCRNGKYHWGLILYWILLIIPTENVRTFLFFHNTHRCYTVRTSIVYWWIKIPKEYCSHRQQTKRNKIVNILSIRYDIRNIKNMIIRWRMKSMLMITFHTYDTSCIHRASSSRCINWFDIDSSMIRWNRFIRTAATRWQIIHWLDCSRRFCMMRFLLLFLFSRWKQANQRDRQ